MKLLIVWLTFLILTLMFFRGANADEEEEE